MLKIVVLCRHERGFNSWFPCTENLPVGIVGTTRPHSISRHHRYRLFTFIDVLHLCSVLDFFLIVESCFVYSEAICIAQYSKVPSCFLCMVYVC